MSYRSSDVCHHPHPLLICLWDETPQRVCWPRDHCCVLSELHPAVPLPVWPLYLPGGCLHRSDWLHGLEGHRRSAAGQWPVDLDQAVRLPGCCALHGLWPHHRRQQVLLPRAPFTRHHHGHLLCRPDVDSTISCRVPGCGGGQEENMRYHGTRSDWPWGWKGGSQSPLSPEWSWTHLTARSPTLSPHLSVAFPHCCYHGNWSTTAFTWLSLTSMVVSCLSSYHGDMVVLSSASPDNSPTFSLWS